MKKEMSSFDVSSLVTEMAALEDAHLDKTYQWDNNVLFRINAKGSGKVDLFFKDKKWLYLSPDRPETPTTPTSFATFMRKYLTNARIGKTRQVGFDRIIIMEVFKAEGDYSLIFEMFGGGNVLLVQDGKIVNCLTQRTFRDRATRPGEDYVMPKERFNPLTSTEEEFSRVFRTSESDTVRTLATVNNLGGQYAEEVCKRAGCEKNVPASEVTDEALSQMYRAMNDIVSQINVKSQPMIFRRDGKIEDIAPVDLQIYEDCEKESAETMSLAIGKLMAETAATEKKEFKDPEIEKLKKRIEKQTETVQAYRQSAERLKAQADALYTEYQKVTELLTVLNEQSRKLSWEKLTEGALKIPYVDYINPEKNIVAMKIGYLTVEMDYTKGIDANAGNPLYNFPNWTIELE
jgi:predicted ribosome quality control (RQC) complex YloA/Tae2 family protein